VNYLVDGGSGDSVDLRDLAQALAEAAILEDSNEIEIERLAADVPAFELGPAHSCTNTLDDQAPFEFRDCADDHDDSAAQRAAGVDLFAEADVLDAEPVQLVEHIEEVLCGPGDPVRGPDQDHIEAAAAGIGHHLVQARPPGFCSGDPVGVFLDDLEAPLSRQLPQIVQLGLGVLVEAGHPHI